MKVDIGNQSQHYAGTAFDVGQTLSDTRRRQLWNSARNSGVWSYVEPISVTPTWVHFDKRFGTPACSYGGYPTLKRGSVSNYVLIAQDDLNTLGFLFEALCERDLKIYAESFDAELYHYQDYNNNEMDAVIAMPDGKWCGFEIKLGANQIDMAAENLIKIKNEIKKFK